MHRIAAVSKAETNQQNQCIVASFSEYIALESASMIGHLVAWYVHFVV
jgi:hypothetical protein